MKNNFYLFFIILNSFLMSFEGDMHDFYLSNGLKVIIYEKHTYPTVALNVVYDVGSHDDPIGKKGLAHVMSELMFEGSKNYNKHEHNSIISSTGGSSGVTGWMIGDYIEFYNGSTVEHFELLLKLESDRMSTLIINTESVTNAVNRAMQTLNEEMESSFWEVAKALLSRYPNKHPYSYHPLGAIEDIMSISVDDCQQSYNNYFVPNNAILVIVGDIDPVESLNIINNYFGSAKSSTSLPKNTNLSLDQMNSSDEITIFNVNNWPMHSYIHSYTTPTARNEDFLIVDFIHDVLQQQSSKFKTNIASSDIFNRGWIYMDQKLGNGMFGFIIETEDVLDFTYHETFVENFIADLKKHGFENSLLKTAIKKNKVSLLSRNYDSKYIARSLGRHEIMHGNYKTYIDNIELFEKITNEDIIRVVNQYFINEYKFVIQSSD